MKLRRDVEASSIVVRGSLALLHLMMAALGFFRHNMIEIVPSYHSFGSIGSTFTWSWTALGIGLGLLLFRRGTLPMIAAQFCSSAFFLLLALLVTAKYGPFWGTLAWGFPASLSLVIMFYNFDEYIRHLKWFNIARERVLERRDAR